MSDFDRAPVGAVLVRWDDGSAIVKGDGSDQEFDELLELLRAQGCDEDGAWGIASVCRDNGVTIVPWAPDSPSAFPPAFLMEISRALSETN